MKRITREVIIKLAKTSQITIIPDEIEQVAEQLDEVLNYAVRVKETAADSILKLYINTNIFRDDVIQPCNSAPLLEHAPERADNFFVVPSIIEIL